MSQASAGQEYPVTSIEITSTLEINWDFSVLDATDKPVIDVRTCISVIQKVISLEKAAAR